VLTSGVTGDDLLGLLGLAADSAPVQTALMQWAHGMQPELDPDDDEAYRDWVTVNEIGLEFGFEDEAYVRALDMAMRRQGPLLLTQLYFYGDTPKTRPFPYPLPFGLSFADDRAAVRRKLAAYDHLRRSYVRDAWRLPDFNLTIAYRRDDGRLESVLCYLPYSPWPTPAGEAELVASFTPDAFCVLFGARWSSALLRSRLAPLGYAEALPDARSEHNADLRMSYGIEFGFAPGRQVPASDPEFPEALALASITYYGPRVYDAHEWVGPMPLGLSFDDSQTRIVERVGREPDQRRDFDQNGYVIWHFERYSLRAEYSNIENHLVRATIMAPGYWTATIAGGGVAHGTQYA
jgi:hypothetical protein